MLPPQGQGGRRRLLWSCLVEAQVRGGGPVFSALVPLCVGCRNCPWGQGCGSVGVDRVRNGAASKGWEGVGWMGRWNGGGVGLCAGRRKTTHRSPPRPWDLPLTESPSSLCSCPAPPLGSCPYLPLNEGHPSETLSSLQVGRTWTTAAVSSCRICTSGTGSAPSAPSASAEKQVAQEPRVPVLPSPLPSWSPWSPAAPHSATRAEIGPQQIFAERKMGWLAQLLPSSKVLLWKSILLSCSPLLGLSLPHLLRLLFCSQRQRGLLCADQ